MAAADGIARLSAAADRQTMTYPTIERAYELARSGEMPDIASLKKRLKADGCRAVDALLAPRGLQSHLKAICLAASQQRGAGSVALDSPGPEV